MIHVATLFDCLLLLFALLLFYYHMYLLAVLGCQDDFGILFKIII